MPRDTRDRANLMSNLLCAHRDFAAVAEPLHEAIESDKEFTQAEADKLLVDFNCVAARIQGCLELMTVPAPVEAPAAEAEPSTPPTT